MPTKFEDVKAGDFIMADGSHECLRPGQVCKVWAEDGLRKNMKITCSDMTEPTHWLHPDEDGNLSGFQKMFNQKGAAEVSDKLVATRDKTSPDR